MHDYSCPPKHPLDSQHPHYYHYKHLLSGIFIPQSVPRGVSFLRIIRAMVPESVVTIFGRTQKPPGLWIKRLKDFPPFDSYFIFKRYYRRSCYLWANIHTIFKAS